MRRSLGLAFAVLAAVALLVCILTFSCVRYAFEPGTENVLNRTRPSPEAYDLWGRTFTQREAQELLQTQGGRLQLSPANGGVRVDDALLKLGRSSFYKETF